MNWLRAIAAVCALWSTAAWGATLTWDTDSAPDLAGYRIYQCSQLPCTLTSGQASPLATLGTVTSFNIGTPTVTQYYFVTAYDLANNESSSSNLATYIPAGASSTPPPPPSPPPVTPPPVPPAAIGATPPSFSFATTQGGANPASQTLSISNSGGGTLSWIASDNAPWLRLSRTSGTNNGVIIVSVITGATAVGTYNGTITLSATGISSVTVPVTITVDTTSVPPPASQTPHRLQVACISVRCSNTYPEVRPGMLWEQNGLGRLPGFILSTDSPYLKIVVTQNRCYGRCTCCLYLARRP